MPASIEEMKITRKASGHYVIDIYDKEGSALVITVGAAKGSPIAQCIRLLDRLLGLADKLAGYNQ